MKNLFQVFGILFFVGIVSVAQATPFSKSKTLKPFDEVKIFGMVEVRLVAGKTEKISVKGDDAENIKVKQRGRTVKIQLLRNVGRNVDARITLTYKELNYISASAGAKVTARRTLVAPRLTIKAKSGSQADFDVETKVLNVSVGEGSIVNLEGRANTQNVKISTGGVLEAYDLTSGESYVNINAGGRAEVYVEGTLDATIKMGGKVLYAGEPSDVKENILISGTVAKAD